MPSTGMAIWPTDAVPWLHELIERHRAALVPDAASEQVRRAGSRFALVAAAGELAAQAGVIGWVKCRDERTGPKARR